MIWTSLLLGIMLRYREDSYLVLNFDYGYYKIIAITAFVLLLCHWLDLYDLTCIDSKWQVGYGLLILLGLLLLSLALADKLFPRFLTDTIFPRLMMDGYSILFGLMILAVSLPAWRLAYSWLAQQPYMRERVYILGGDERAQRLVRGLEARVDLGFDLVGWSGEIEGELTRDSMADHMLKAATETAVDRIIVALRDRRTAMPMEALLQLRLQGRIRIEDATSWLEKISGKIDLEELHPSWLIFAEGFRFTDRFKVLRRMLDCAAGFLGLLLTAPLIPLIMALIKLDSRGPVFYQQQRVGLGGRVFYCYKFRTMREDAEADIGPTWADDDDPRITKIGRILRLLRFDEIPQLWCVLKGDMAFVGPRPERPEFVESLTQEIRYYDHRHVVRPGITGWAQIRYKYGNTVQDAQEKLQYDLFYIKNASIGLDVFIMFQTIKIVLWQRGAL